MKNKFIAKSIRLSRYLYSLGFDKKSIIIDDVEVWEFEKSDKLQEALDFYFYFRKNNIKQELVNDKGKI